jgi:hypothetical protein
MKRQWKLRRQFQPTTDAKRRWDQAYQHLLGWNVPPNSDSGPLPWVRLPQKAEVRNEGGDLCSCIHQPSDPGTND